MSVWVEIEINLAHTRLPQVTLHVSVWVEIMFVQKVNCNTWVTLHVSVWVEIWQRLKRFAGFYVTLHVSVWVEILYLYYSTWCHVSRSTWACELKSFLNFVGRFSKLSRSTWACELKLPDHQVSRLNFEVTLHVSVWVEIHLKYCPLRFLLSHAPRERVSWNICVVYMPFCQNVTLHVSVWVEIQQIFYFHHVDMSRSTWACELKLSSMNSPLFLPLSRSTWACELKS